MSKIDELLQAIAPDSAYAKGFRDALESLVLALRAEHVGEPMITNALINVADAYDNNADMADPEHGKANVQEPQAYMVMGGRLYKDRVFVTRPSAEESLRNRNDGARIRPLVFAREG